MFASFAVSVSARPRQRNPPGVVQVDLLFLFSSFMSTCFLCPRPSRVSGQRNPPGVLEVEMYTIHLPVGKSTDFFPRAWAGAGAGRRGVERQARHGLDAAERERRSSPWREARVLLGGATRA